MDSVHTIPIEPQVQTTFNNWEGIPDGLQVSSIWYETVFFNTDDRTSEGRKVLQEETCIFAGNGDSMVVGSYSDHDYFVWKVKNDAEWLRKLLATMGGYHDE